MGQVSLLLSALLSAYSMIWCNLQLIERQLKAKEQLSQLLVSIAYAYAGGG
jgi:hypothetical protein